jgi:hypothetical protein
MVDSWFINSKVDVPNDGDHPGAAFEFNARRLELELIRGLRRCLLVLDRLELTPPLFVMITLMGVKGCRLWTEQVHESMIIPFDRDVLVLPDSVVQNFDDQAEMVLKPAFDAMWQAAGQESCRHYEIGGGRPDLDMRLS